MTRYVGVKGWGVGDISGELKRAAILFDQIALRHTHGEKDCEQYPETNHDIEWLRDRKIVVRGPEAVYDDERHPWLHSFPPTILSDPTNAVKSFILKHLTDWDVLSINEFEHQHFTAAADVYGRVAAVELQSEDTVALPLLATSTTTESCLPTRKADVLRVVYEGIPMPDETTPWQAILDFRNDDAAREQFVRLRCWINKSTRSEVSASEVRDELEALIAAYCTYMKGQHRRLAVGRLELFCTAVGECLDSFPLLKVSPMLKVLFRAERLQRDLMEEELKAPGREVAYVVAARSQFGLGVKT